MGSIVPAPTWRVNWFVPFTVNVVLPRRMTQAPVFWQKLFDSWSTEVDGSAVVLTPRGSLVVLFNPVEDVG